MDLPIPFDANGLETVSMALQNRMMTLVAFLQAQNCSNLPGSWRHPATMLDFLTPEYYQRIARTLEDGKIQMAFLDDRLALPDIYTGHHAEAIGAGVRAVKLDPCTIMMAMGMVTQRLGLGATYSTTYYEPYHVARVFATMDLMLKSRAAVEHRDLAQQRRGQELRSRRTHGTRRPLRPGGRVHGCGPWPLEHLGRRCADPSTRRTTALPIRQRCTGWITWDIIFNRAAHSACRARRKGIPCSSRRVNPAAASLLPRSGPTWCL
jgi:hypothetical protein